MSPGYTQARAPVTGRVGRLEITVGNLVAAGPGAPVLTALVAVSPIYASFDAAGQIVTRALRELQGQDKCVGASAHAQLEKIPVHMGTAGTPDTPFAGKLQLVDNPVDAKSGTVRVRGLCGCAGADQQHGAGRCEQPAAAGRVDQIHRVPH